MRSYRVTEQCPSNLIEGFTALTWTGKDKIRACSAIFKCSKALKKFSRIGEQLAAIFVFHSGDCIKA